jgi:hypothetical protein
VNYQCCRIWNYFLRVPARAFAFFVWQRRSREFTVVYGDRKDQRIRFEGGIDVMLIGIDGTWRRPATLMDISASGARVILHQSMTGLNMKEFFLLLTPSGSTFRRCEMVRVNGEELGVRFLAPPQSRGRKARRPPSTSVDS